MVRTRNQPASPQKDVETKPRASRSGKTAIVPPQNGTKHPTRASKSPAAPSGDKKTTTKKQHLEMQTPEEADPEEAAPISRRGLRSQSSDKKAESVSSSIENDRSKATPKSAERLLEESLKVKAARSAESERLSDSSDDEESALSSKSGFLKVPTVRIQVASPMKYDENEDESLSEEDNEAKKWPIKLHVEGKTNKPDVSPGRLNVELRDRRPTMSKTVVIVKEEDSGSDYDVDDNADFDFSDKDSDFDIEKELETRPKKKRNLDAESESEGEFEEVEDKHIESEEDDLMLDRPLESGLEGPLEITVDMPGVGGKKKEMDKDKWIASQLRRRDKDMKTDIHKVHLLCGIAHGFYLSEKIGRNQELLSLAMSVWDKTTLNKAKDFLKMDFNKLRELVAAVKEKFSFAPHLLIGICSADALNNTLLTKQCPSYLHMTMMILLMLRSLGLEVRLVYSMQPVPVKDTKAKVVSATKRKTATKSKMKVEEENESEYEVDEPKAKSKAKRVTRKRARSDSDEEKEVEKMTKRPARKAAKNAAGKRKPIRTEDDESNADVEMSEAESENGAKKKAKGKTPADRTAAKKIKEEADEEERKPTGKLLEVPKAESAKELPNTSFVSATSALSYKSIIKEKGIDYWIEVYCGKSKTYVPVHCISGKVGADADVERSATQPLHYVVAFGEKSSMKDVSAAYAAEWLTVNRKLQVDVDWWKDQLDSYRPLDKKKDEAEDNAIHEILLCRPRPDIPQLYKGHPLYILRPHLAKYEALYPPNPIPVDEVKGEPVFLRECAKLLHTRENWLREAKTVKKGEMPYKEVKKIQRKKQNRRGRNDPNAMLMAQIAEKEAQKVEMVGLFGEWQIEDFVPPVAENGKVPRNSYGNVELYQPSMLPFGCVYINIKGLNRVAKKLDIDCAAAVTGWEFQGWRAHPVIEGWVVCKEYEKELMKAWKTEEIEMAKRAKERKSKKAMDNWRKIFKGLALKRRLQMKYGIDFTSSEKLKDFIQKTDMTKVESDVE